MVLDLASLNISNDNASERTFDTDIDKQIFDVLGHFIMSETDVEVWECPPNKDFNSAESRWDIFIPLIKNLDMWKDLARNVGEYVLEDWLDPMSYDIKHEINQETNILTVILILQCCY